MWDSLSTADKTTLTNFIAENGNTVPLVGPTSGHQIIDFNGLVVGSNATGLNSTATATSGYGTINIGGNKTISSISGLSAAAGTHGAQVVNFGATAVGSTSTRLFAGTAATAGKATLSFTATPTITPTTAVGILAGSYDISVNIDGAGATVHTIVATGTDTMTSLAALITSTLIGATAVASTNKIIITSSTPGASSSIVITVPAGGINPDLFASIDTSLTSLHTNVSIGGTASVPATTYTATITVDGVAKAISIIGSAAQTFTTLVSEINTDLGVSATASISGGNIKITSASYGTTSKVLITVGTLFSAVAGYIDTFPSQNGGGASRNYSATVVVDGVIKTVNFTGLQGDTIQHVLDELNVDLGASAVAALSGGNIVITSASTGVLSNVKLYDSGFLFNSLTGYVNVSDVNGTAPTTYTATIKVDGTDKAISIIGSAAQTFTTLVSEINTDLGVSATASISGGNIKITSASTGLASTINITDHTLFKGLNIKGFQFPNNGITSLIDAAKHTRSSNGSTIFEQFDILYIGLKPHVALHTPHSIKFTYWDGTIWRYLDNDAAV
jgi:hypothetical protein